MLRLLDLPRDILVHLLLHHFTVQEVIQIRSLCHELYDLVHYCLGKRRTLKLFFSFAEVQAYTRLLYKYNLESDPVLRLHPPGQSSDELILNQHKFLNLVADLLVDRFFPNVTHLIIYFGYETLQGKPTEDYNRFSHLFQHNVPYLIGRMRTRLVGLSLFGQNRGDEDGREISHRLLGEINQICNLRRLDLCVRWLFIYTQSYVQNFSALEPKLLAKLERISVLFDLEKTGSNFCEQSFRHFGPHLTHLIIHQLDAVVEWNYVPEPLLCRLLTCNHHSITHLKLTQHLSTLLPKVLPRFTQLKSLDLVNFIFSKTESPMSSLELFRLLAHCCPALAELKLRLFTFGWIRETTDLIDLPQLEHIKQLVLECICVANLRDQVIAPADLNIPFDRFISTIGYIFPNLTRLYLKMVPSYFSISDTETIPPLGLNPSLRMFTVGFYSGHFYTAHQLLSAPYRQRYIRECGEKWEELQEYWSMHCKDVDGVWQEENDL